MLIVLFCYPIRYLFDILPRKDPNSNSLRDNVNLALFLAIFMQTTIVVLYHLPPNLPKFYDQERAVVQTFIMFAINTYATFTAQRMAGI